MRLKRSDCVFACVHVYMCMSSVYAWVCVHYVYMQTCVSTCACVCVCAYLCIWGSVCMWVFMRVRVYVFERECVWRTGWPCYWEASYCELALESGRLPFIIRGIWLEFGMTFKLAFSQVYSRVMKTLLKTCTHTNTHISGNKHIHKCTCLSWCHWVHSGYHVASWELIITHKTQFPMSPQESCNLYILSLLIPPHPHLVSTADYRGTDTHHPPHTDTHHIYTHTHYTCTHILSHTHAPFARKHRNAAKSIMWSIYSICSSSHNLPFNPDRHRHLAMLVHFVCSIWQL